MCVVSSDISKIVVKDLRPVKIYVLERNIKKESRQIVLQNICAVTDKPIQDQMRVARQTQITARSELSVCVLSTASGLQVIESKAPDEKDRTNYCHQRRSKYPSVSSILRYNDKLFFLAGSSTKKESHRTWRRVPKDNGSA